MCQCLYLARIPEYFNAACKICSQQEYYAALCGVAPLLGPLPGNRDDRQSGEMLGNSNEAGFTNKKESASIARPSSPVSTQDEAPDGCDARSLRRLPI